MCVFLKTIWSCFWFTSLSKDSQFTFGDRSGIKEGAGNRPRTQQERFKSSEFGRSIERTELGSMIYL